MNILQYIWHLSFTLHSKIFKQVKSFWPDTSRLPFLFTSSNTEIGPLLWLPRLPTEFQKKCTNGNRGRQGKSCYWRVNHSGFRRVHKQEINKYRHFIKRNNLKNCQYKSSHHIRELCRGSSWGTVKKIKGNNCSKQIKTGTPKHIYA